MIPGTVFANMLKISTERTIFLKLVITLQSYTLIILIVV